jgi:adenylyltransferase/sulfurtransferase
VDRQRYNRQVLLPQIGEAGQSKLAASRVLVIGCGALGSVIAEQLVRAGIGHLRIADRDIVELSNLQRQVLFDEEDAKQGLPKAVAAAQRLLRVNSSVEILPLVVDVYSENIEELIGEKTDLILDGTDNVETRYLLNDACVKLGVPWVYGACVGTEGRVMAIRPGVTPCVRCVFQQLPAAGELPTCDTAGVLGSAAGVAASLQVVAAIKLLTGNVDAVGRELITFDLWSNRIRSVDTTGSRRADCPACGQRRFEFLEQRNGSLTTALCGRNAVQVRPPAGAAPDASKVAERLSAVGKVEKNSYLLRCQLSDTEGLTLSLFADGRLIVHGTSDPARARSIYARYVGS